MEIIYVNSSMIRSIGYDQNSSTLQVEFNSGVTWQYYDFNESEWLQFQNAESIGKYFNANIRDRYQGSKI